MNTPKFQIGDFVRTYTEAHYIGIVVGCRTTEFFNSVCSVYWLKGGYISHQMTYLSMEKYEGKK